MQPGEPLSPGETYYDKDLDVEVVVVQSLGCSFPPRRAEPNKSKRVPCVYKGSCRTSKSCITPHPQPNIVYLSKLQYATFKLTRLVI